MQQEVVSDERGELLHVDSDQDSEQNLSSTAAINSDSNEQHNAETHCTSLKDNWELITKETIQKLSPGDVISRKYCGFSYRMIVDSVEVKKDANENFEKATISAIYYGRQGIKRRIVRDVFSIQADGSSSVLKPKCWLQHQPNEWCYSPEVVVQRARSRVNEAQHSFFGNMASDFVRWCKTRCSSHRPDNLVPIYVSEDNKNMIHSVKSGDHLEVKCAGRDRLHCKVLTTTKLNNSKFELTMRATSVDTGTKHIRMVHERKIELQRNKLVKVSVNLQGIDLSNRTEKINNLIYKNKRARMHDFCLHLTNPNMSDEEWMQTVVDVPKRHWSFRIRFFKPTKPAENLNKGDIVYIQGHYQVVTNVAFNDSKVEITTMLYGKKELKANEPIEVKLAIEAKERDAILCVHNDAALDCPLEGGGRKKPSYTFERIKDSAQIQKGCTISMRSGSPLFKHCIVSSVATDNESATESESASDSEFFVESSDIVSFSAISYELGSLIAEKSFTLNVSKSTIYRVTYNVSDKSMYSSNEVVERARSRLGERQHNIQWNSRGDFARWCSIKHQSNREQTRVPVNSADELHAFKQGHVRFLKLLPYSHHAILRDCSKVEGCNDILRVSMYENNVAYKCVRKEQLNISENETVRRVRYAERREVNSASVEQLLGLTFLNADDDRLGFSGPIVKKCGSRVKSEDFCCWIKTSYCERGEKAVQELFDQSTRKQVEVEEIGRDSVNIFDHIILTRKANGKDIEVHFIVTKWDSIACTGVGMTYEFSAEKVGLRFKKFDGFLRVTGPGHIEKVVHNSELNWDQIDAKFKELEGIEEYSLLFNNCEHFVNYLIYGRLTCSQLSRVTGLGTKWINMVVRGFRPWFHCADDH
ncbi:hypothetical protein BOX15_Mlig034298g1 [Macrostomum lignano]|uniref:LRAT domain-containing protein n=1 Tax=Macrostomum lignano TaxID=282301 RepID=A0A267DD80_9PLAT|nr:hypothetical protein BOX15_Mlig034298g1 [Macrostomum lignano]